MVAGGAAGATIGAVTGHVKGGMDDGDLKQLGTTLEKGKAGLLVVYATNMADQIAASIKAENRFVSRRSTPTPTSWPSSSRKPRARASRHHRPSIGRSMAETRTGPAARVAGPVSRGASSGLPDVGLPRGARPL